MWSYHKDFFSVLLLNYLYSFFLFPVNLYFNLTLLGLFVFRQETVEQLLSNIFDKEKNESAIVSVIQILLTLFETRRPAYVAFVVLSSPTINYSEV